MQGLYYFAKKIYQLAQSKPIFSRLGGKVFTYWDFPITYLYHLGRYGPFRAGIMRKGLTRLDQAARGLILCHSGEGIVPPGKNYSRIFIYHGTCDTVYKAEGPDGKLLSDWFEYFFVTGDKDLDKLRRYTYDPENLEGKIVNIGMFLSDPIYNNSYDREAIFSKYGIKANGKKIILYAPTWSWGAGTLSQCFDHFISRIPDKYVFIIRPHYNDRKNIRHILRWQKEHRLKDFYFFPKQYQDVMDFVHVSDLLIGDNSSVNYDFALTKKPIVLVKSEEHENLFVPPDEYNIKLCCPVYDPKGNDDVLEKIEEAFSSPKHRERIDRLVQNSFYFNDGHAVDRACSFIVDTLSEMKIIDRDKTLKKYGRFFQYNNSYQ
jgi:CDP-glycerol glycerophosphotransferase (TagB/SpsB family)